jgi:hypothetical protein
MESCLKPSRFLFIFSPFVCYILLSVPYVPPLFFFLHLGWRVLASPGWVFLLLWDFQLKLSTQAAGYMAYTHCWELMKWVSCDRKVAILHVTVNAHWTCETVTAVHAASFIVQFKLVLSFGVSLLLCSSVLYVVFFFDLKRKVLSSDSGYLQCECGEISILIRILSPTE